MSAKAARQLPHSAGAGCDIAAAKTPEHHAGSGVFPEQQGCTADQHLARQQGIESIMAPRQHQRIVETPTEARQAEPGPSVLALLIISLGLVLLLMGVVWFVFFRT
jgi:hypothetical protein